MNIFRTFPVAIGLGTLAALTACGVAPLSITPSGVSTEALDCKSGTIFGNQTRPVRIRRIKCIIARALFRAVHIQCTFSVGAQLFVLSTCIYKIRSLGGHTNAAINTDGFGIHVTIRDALNNHRCQFCAVTQTVRE